MVRQRIKEPKLISLDRSIELYLLTMEAEGKSPRYINWLNTRLNFFTDFIKNAYGDNFPLQELEVHDGREFIRSLMNREYKYLNHPEITPKHGKLSPSYVHGCGRAVKSFFTWANKEGYLEENVMGRMKLPKILPKMPEPLNEYEIRQVLAAALDETYECLRNFAILMIFLDTGIRLGELCNLRLSKVDFNIGEIQILGKGNKERIVPIGIQTKKALLDYIAKERLEPSSPSDADFVFLTADGNQITPTAVEKVFERIKRLTGLTKFHPHICRHTFSVRYLIHGGDAFSLQRILGHKSLETTRKYVNLAFGDIKEKHRQFSPMDNLGFRRGVRGRRKSTPS